MSRVMRHSFGFFFSSRRRHTRCYRDWSSDVCSSDLVGIPGGHRDDADREPRRRLADPAPREIGRASCRERVYISVVAVSLKKKNKMKPVKITTTLIYGEKKMHVRNHLKA